MNLFSWKPPAGTLLAVVLCCGLPALALSCGSSPDSGANANPAIRGPIPEGPPGVGYRASCEFKATGICVDVFTDGGLDARQAYPRGCTPLQVTCSRKQVIGLCKIERRQSGARVYSERIFYSRAAGRKVTEDCINNSGRLVRYDY